MNVITENDIDSDMVELIPLGDQLTMCNNLLSDDGSSTNIKPSDGEINFLSDEVEAENRPSTSNCNNFQVYKDTIPCVPSDEQDEGLSSLGVCVYDQTQFENEVMDQVDKAMKAQEERKRKDEIERELKVVADDIRFAKKRLSQIEKALAMVPRESTCMTSLAKREVVSIKKEQENKLKHLKKLEAKQKTLQACISGNADDINCLQDNLDGDEDIDEETKYHLQQVFASKETEEERLIRLGEMTPFGTDMAKQRTSKKERKIVIPENELTDFDKFLLGEAEACAKKKAAKSPQKQTSLSKSLSKTTSSVTKSTTSAFEPTPSTSKSSEEFVTFTDLRAVPRKKHKPKIKLGTKHAKGYNKKQSLSRSLVKNYKSDSEVSDICMDEDSISGSDQEYLPDEDLSDEWERGSPKKGASSKRKKNLKTSKKFDSSSEYDSDYEVKPKKSSGKVIDDGNQEAYIKRIKAFEKAELVKKHQKILESEDGIVEENEDYTEFDEDFKIPNSVWNKLYKYQQTGVRWLWELHQQNCGGIIGDEMGLGKTIQIIAFLVGLSFSQLHTIGDSFKGLGPVILVCPATVMHQWVKEFHTWWPPFRVAVLHESGSFVGQKEMLVRNINKRCGVLITSYAGVVQHQTNLLEKEWHYVILDEGHKIRNPDAQATLVVKQFRTPHRFILSGSPVQNNLKELWSLFDFIFPGKLGTLPVFMQQFSVPIVQGGYASASQIQVQTAYKCATVLRDTIKPYLLRRMKSDVKMSINLPNKNEQVLFCQLTEDQANLYKGYINSKEVGSILSARLQVFVGLINLRKICNHPDIFDGGPKIFKHTDLSTLSEEEHYGYYKRSGKMIVVEALLRLWHKQDHRVLLFTQSRQGTSWENVLREKTQLVGKAVTPKMGLKRTGVNGHSKGNSLFQMMDVLEIFVKSKGYTYMKMDGTTSIGSRQPAINKFNSDKSIFVFLLTTRVGGLGVNLTGADRIIIYDPDWNPSTDAQARERAWRIGQEKQVTIYRLLTAGTIEEKIYHRQIFKQFVTNRVLKDPRQRRFFKSNDLYELFTYQEVGPRGTETSAIFAGTGSEVKPKKRHHQHHANRPTQAEKDAAIHPQKKDAVSFSAEKLEQMKLLAKKLSADLCKKSAEPAKEASSVNDKSEKNPEVKDCSESKITNEDKVNDDKRKSLGSSVKHGKKPRKRKAQEVDGEKIEFVVKKDVYKPPQDENEKSKNDDDYVLSKLFKSSGVHTALKHDKIVESSDPDYMIVEGEASRVAKDAIKALRESRRMCARAEEGIPTWTGNNGGRRNKPLFGQKKKMNPFLRDSVSSTPEEPKSSGIIFGGQKEAPTQLSSSGLLAAIRKRTKVFGTDDRNDDSNDEIPLPVTTQPQPGTEYDELLVDIRNFVAFGSSVDGQATTKELVDKFRDKLPVHQTAVFKAMLSKICVFSRSGGEGIWQLKEEFQ